jgi:putative endopeptidase
LDEPGDQAEGPGKTRLFTTKIGYPDQWKDYSMVEIKPDDLFGNTMHLIEWQQQRQPPAHRQARGPKEWGMTPQTVNAYYNPTMNEVVFPAGILQPPFFNPDADDAINYGGIIAVIGHELTHGFDDQGAKYDGHGNLVNWWTAQRQSQLRLPRPKADHLLRQAWKPCPVYAHQRRAHRGREHRRPRRSHR